MMRWKSALAGAALLLVCLVVGGAGWSSKISQGTEYRSTYFAVDDGDTIYFPQKSFGVNHLGTGGGSAVADSSRPVRWIHWNMLTTTSVVGTLIVFTDAAPAGRDTVIAGAQAGIVANGTYGGVRGITKVVFEGAALGTNLIQITGTD